MYIARKRGRGGKRFGFVRMKDKKDANRIIERLHGFKLYGLILTVKYATNSQVRKGKFVSKNKDFDVRTSFNISNKNAETSRFESRVIREDRVWNIPCGESLKRISGHVENEELWKLRKCLVGETTTVCSVSSIHSRMLNWGMGEIKIQRLGARSFLLTIQDEDLYLMLEDLDWSYLKEILATLNCGLKRQAREQLGWRVVGKFRSFGGECKPYLRLREGENNKDFFEELEARKSQRRGKKFGSLIDMQNRCISDRDRRKTNKALKKRIFSKLLLEETELSGMSLSNSDIKAR
ncbi:hypothetical protein V6N13_105228 [Hibiscus sabdariffa]